MNPSSKSVYVLAFLLSLSVAFASVSNAALNVKSTRYEEKGLVDLGNTGPPNTEKAYLSVVSSLYKYFPHFDNPSQKLSL